MRARLRSWGTRVTAAVAIITSVTLAVAGTASAQGADRLPETLDIAPSDTAPSDTAPSDTAPSDTAPTDVAPVDPERDPVDLRPPLPPLPSAEELKDLLRTPLRFSRPVLRRAARTAPDTRRRALGLALLARADPTRATARICARSLRIDPEPRVRRAAAECLGRLPSNVAAPETPALVSALDDAALDVITMAGWALANVGDASALARLTALASHDDARVAKLFYDYTLRLRARSGLRLQEVPEEPVGPRLVPPGDAVISQTSSLDATASAAWLVLYGGMSGWLHGGFFPAAHGGAGFQQLTSLTALGGAVVGAAAGGAYAYLGADRLNLAHTVVQLGSFGSLAGYGAGIFSEVPPANGLNMASFSLVGGLVGTGMGIALVQGVEPTPGALGLGLTVGLGTGVSFTALGYGYKLPISYGLAAGLFAGGIAGSLATILAAPYEIGLLPVTGATLGGLTGATAAALAVGLAENAQLAGGANRPFTEGSGWAAASGYVVGAVLGAGAFMLVPPELDPFRDSLRLRPPTIALLDDKARPGAAVPVAMVSGTF